MRIGLFLLAVVAGTASVCVAQDATFTVSAAPASGATTTVTAVISDPNGYDANSTAQINIGWDGGGRDACYLMYQIQANALYLMNDTATAMSGPAVPGSAQTLSNSQCSVNVQQTTATVSGGTVTLKPRITFDATFVGNLSITPIVWDATGNGFWGWANAVSYTAFAANPAPPSVVSLPVPSPGYGVSTTLVLQVSDPNGAKYIRLASIVVGWDLWDSVCSVDYVGGYGAVLDEEGTRSDSDGACVLTANPTVARSGNTLSITAPLQFVGFSRISGNQFTGRFDIGAEVADAAQSSQWSQTGQWGIGYVAIPATTGGQYLQQGVGRTGGPYSAGLAAQAATHWSTTAIDGWIHITSGATGTGNQTVSYTVDANPSGAPRFGLISIDEVGDIANNGGGLGIYIQVNQDSLNLTPSAFSFGTGAGGGTVNVTGSGYWNAWAADTWVHVTSATGMDAGTLTFTVDANSTGASRTSRVNIGYGGVAVTQAGPVAVSSTSLSSGAIGTAYSQTLAAAGGTPPYSGWTVAAGTLPAGLNLTASSGVVSGTPTVGGATAFTFGVRVSDALGALSAVKTVSMNILPRPSLTVEHPVAVESVWGDYHVSGYALENAPWMPSDRISRVGISITRDDDTVNSFNDSAVYGTAPTPPICIAGGANAGGTDCPNVHFDYMWHTGAAVNSTAPFTNGKYTLTTTAYDSSQPALPSMPSSVSVTVDNQPPSPVISSPVNGNGVYGTSQQFTLLMVSPHSNLDFGNGQVIFDGVNSNKCVVQWTASGGGSLALTGTSGAPSPCTLDSARSAVSNNGTNQLTLKIWITFPSFMVGGVTVSASGSNAEGEMSPLSAVTSYTVTTGPGAPPIPQAYPVVAVMPLGGSVSVTQTMYIPPGATVTQSAAYGGYCSGSNIQMQVLGSPSMSANGQLITVTAQFTTSNPYNETVSASLACNVSFVLFGSGPMTQSYATITVTASYFGSFNTTIVGGLISLVQSGAMSAGTINISAGANPSVTSVPNGLSAVLNGTNQLIVTVTNPSLPAGAYAIRIQGFFAASFALPAYYGTVFVTVAPVSIPEVTIGPISPVSLAANAVPTTFTVTVSPVNGYAGMVQLAQTANSNTASIGLTFNPSTLNLATGPKTTTATLVASQSTNVATYQVLFTVSDTASPAAFAAHSVNVTVSVQGGPATSYSLSAAPIRLKLGQSGSGNITVMPSAGYSGAVTVNIGSLPAGLSAVFIGSPGTSTQWPITLTPGVNATLPISVTAQLPIPASGCSGCTFVVTGTGGGVANQATTVAVPVSSPDPLSANVSVSGLKDAATGYYPTALPIYFVRQSPSNAVGTETFQWSVFTLPSGNWTLPAGLPSGTSQVTVTPTVPALYCAQFTVTDSLGRTATSSQFGGCASVAPGLGVTVSGPTATTVGSPVTLTANASGGSGSYTYTWTNAVRGGNPSTAVFTPGSASGTPVQVMVQVADANGGAQTVAASIGITVYPQLTITVTGGAPTRVGQSLSLTASASGGSGSGFTYAWTGAQATASNPTLATFNASTAPSQAVTAQVRDSAGNTKSYITTIIVNPASSLGVVLTAPRSAATQSPVTLTALGTNGSGHFSYTWVGATPTGDGSTATFMRAQSGTYPVSVMVTDLNAGNATSTNSAPIKVLPGCSVVPAREYMRMAGRTVAIDNPECIAGQ